jgi:hypothetical protein
MYDFGAAFSGIAFIYNFMKIREAILDLKHADIDRRTGRHYLYSLFLSTLHRERVIYITFSNKITHFPKDMAERIIQDGIE